MIDDGGDVKAVVLALQALQAKVRSLERDRDFHRLQCQNSHNAHEHYKRDVEAQIEAERAEHRRNEQRLQLLLDEASSQKRVLEDSLDASKIDIVAFRNQLSDLLLKERSNNAEREDVLRNDLANCKKEITELRCYHEDLTHSILQLKTEKKMLLETNARLEQTVFDLLEFNKKSSNKLRVVNTAALSCFGHSSRSRSGSSLESRQIIDEFNGATSNDVSHRSLSKSKSNTFADPTVSSMSRALEKRKEQSPMRPISPSRYSKCSSTDSLQDLSKNLYKEAETEYQNLINCYTKKVSEGAPNHNELKDLLASIDHKAGQLRLMRLARLNTNERFSVNPSRSPRGVQKAAQRGALVNQIRGMLDA